MPGNDDGMAVVGGRLAFRNVSNEKMHSIHEKIRDGGIKLDAIHTVAFVGGKEGMTITFQALVKLFALFECKHVVFDGVSFHDTFTGDIPQWMKGASFEGVESIVVRGCAASDGKCDSLPATPEYAEEWLLGKDATVAADELEGDGEDIDEFFEMNSEEDDYCGPSEMDDVIPRLVSLFPSLRRLYIDQTHLYLNTEVLCALQPLAQLEVIEMSRSEKSVEGGYLDISDDGVEEYLLSMHTLKHVSIHYASGLQASFVPKLLQANPNLRSLSLTCYDRQDDFTNPILLGEEITMEPHGLECLEIYGKMDDQILCLVDKCPQLKVLSLIGKPYTKGDERIFDRLPDLMAIRLGPSWLAASPVVQKLLSLPLQVLMCVATHPSPGVSFSEELVALLQKVKGIAWRPVMCDGGSCVDTLVSLPQVTHLGVYGEGSCPEKEIPVGTLGELKRIWVGGSLSWLSSVLAEKVRGSELAAMDPPGSCLRFVDSVVPDLFSSDIYYPSTIKKKE